MMKEFPQKEWSRASHDRFNKKIDTDGTRGRRPGSDRPKSISTTDNIAVVQDLICRG